jgi:hypothetical protein
MAQPVGGDGTATVVAYLDGELAGVIAHLDVDMPGVAVLEGVGEAFLHDVSAVRPAISTFLSASRSSALLAGIRCRTALTCRTVRIVLTIAVAVVLTATGRRPEQWCKRETRVVAC